MSRISNTFIGAFALVCFVSLNTFAADETPSVNPSESVTERAAETLKAIKMAGTLFSSHFSESFRGDLKNAQSQGPAELAIACEAASEMYDKLFNHPETVYHGVPQLKEMMSEDEWSAWLAEYRQFYRDLEFMWIIKEFCNL